MLLFIKTNFSQIIKILYCMLFIFFRSPFINVWININVVFTTCSVFTNVYNISSIYLLVADYDGVHALSWVSNCKRLGTGGRW